MVTFIKPRKKLLDFSKRRGLIHVGVQNNFSCGRLNAVPDTGCFAAVIPPDHFKAWMFLDKASNYLVTSVSGSVVVNDNFPGVFCLGKEAGHLFQDSSFEVGFFVVITDDDRELWFH